MNDEISTLLIEEAENLEEHGIEAFKNKKISLDQYHQLTLIAMQYIHEEITPVYAYEDEFAFALMMARACAEEIRRGVEHNNIAYSLSALRLGNIGIGIAKRIEKEKERKKQKARNAANIKHAKTATHKEIVWDYYKQDLHKFKSLDQAAEKISLKPDVPYAFRTIRKWLAEFKKSQKKLPPA